MEEEPLQPANTFADTSNQDNNKSKSNYHIVGYNMLVLAFYTFICKLTGSDGYIFDAMLLVLHVLVCIILAIVVRGNKGWMWVLGAVLVLVVGISTCVVIPTFGQY